MKLTLDGAGRNLAEIDLGEPDTNGYLDGGDLSATGGNLYLNVDGKEYGSVFFFVRNGNLTITLGQFDDDAQEWVERVTLDHPVDQEG